MRRRTAEQWDRLSENYRRRLVRQGVGREDYLSGANLQSARGQSREKVHDRQRHLVRKYGPVDIVGTPYLTPKMLQKARREHGDQWVTQRLETLAKDYLRSARGGVVYPGDPEYSRLADEPSYRAGRNPYAPFYWYHGAFS